jgi:hypothetical protein
MAFTTHILVLANRTVDAAPLTAAIEERAHRGPVAITLLVPARLDERDAARKRMEGAVARLRELGIEAEGRLGPEEPISAIAEEYDNTRYDEIIVSTLAEGQSRWLAQGLPGRVTRLTGAVVHHVACRPEPAGVAKPAPRAAARHKPVFEGILSQLHVDTNDVGHPYG